uniref:Ovule protein n=1 Tax=Romanomermis culicivorax TaxID=13658 RepID=A0A915JIH3_ROMCU
MDLGSKTRESWNVERTLALNFCNKLLSFVSLKKKVFKSSMGFPCMLQQTFDLILSLLRSIQIKERDICL